MKLNFKVKKYKDMTPIELESEIKSSKRLTNFNLIFSIIGIVLIYSGIIIVKQWEISCIGLVVFNVSLLMSLIFILQVYVAKTELRLRSLEEEQRNE